MGDSNNKHAVAVETSHPAFNNQFSGTEIIHCQEFIDSIKQNVGILFPYEAFYCSFGCMNNNNVQVLKLIHDQFPLEYFNDLANDENNSFQSPLVNEWYATRRPVLFQADRDAEKYHATWVETFNRHHLQNVVAHGKLDLQNGFFSSFSFYRIPGAVTSWHVGIIEQLVPHLHDALLTALGPMLMAETAREESPLLLTASQKEILYWMQQGKTDWETSKILGFSQSNVKYHVRQILVKLNATNRTHAVGKALESGVLEHVAE